MEQITVDGDGSLVDPHDTPVDWRQPHCGWVVQRQDAAGAGRLPRIVAGSRGASNRIKGTAGVGLNKEALPIVLRALIADGHGRLSQGQAWECSLCDDKKANENLTHLMLPGE